VFSIGSIAARVVEFTFLYQESDNNISKTYVTTTIALGFVALIGLFQAISIYDIKNTTKIAIELKKIPSRKD
jgi:hypothetical protein